MMLLLLAPQEVPGFWATSKSLAVVSNSNEQVVQTHLCTSTLCEACDTPTVFDNELGAILDGYIVSTTTLRYWLPPGRDP